MSKQDDQNFIKIQSCILKVHIHCDGCKQKVKKLLQKIEGVYTVTVEAEQGKVNVSGNVDPNTLIKKLSKSGKHAELISPKISSNNPKTAVAKQTNNNGKPQNQKGGNVINGGEGVKDQKAQIQMKGLNKDVKVPQLAVQKDSKSVKFALPPEEEDSEFDDEFDDDDDDLEAMDEFDDDFDDSIKTFKSTKPANNGNNAMKSGGNQKKAEAPVQVKGINGNNGKKGGADAGDSGKNGKGNNKSAPTNGKNNMGQPQMGPMSPPQMGQMGAPQIGNMPPQAAVQGLPAGAVLTPGYFQGQVAAPNPYQQQQYIQAMQQQQRMMMMNGQDHMYPMMGYPRPPPYAMYMQPPPQNVLYTDYFSEENPSSCSRGEASLGIEGAADPPQIPSPWYHNVFY